MSESSGSRLTALGIVATLGLAVGLVGLGAMLVFGGEDAKSPDVAPGADVVANGEAPSADPASALALVAPEESVPRLDVAAPYVPKDNVVEIEISEYAGYAGLIAANGGLAPNPDSWFSKNAGFQVKLTVSEADAWSSLNAGRIGAAATTVDVLPLYGRQLEAVVPVQLGFSRGADAIVVRSDIKRMNDLRGKVVVAAQFSEAEFFLRYLAQEAGIPVRTVAEPLATDNQAIHVAFAEDAFVAGDVFLSDLSGGDQLAGCVTWDPKTGEVVEGSKGEAKILTTNRNLLVIADVLLVNRGFAEQNPAMVKGLVEGVLWGNDSLRRGGGDVAVVAKAFGWTDAEAKAELSKVHLSNLPENLAFFGGKIDMAGSFGGIFQSSVLAYGREIVRDVTSPDRFVDTTALTALQGEGKFADQAVDIAPIKGSGQGSIEDDPLLSKDIRFFFEPNSSGLDMAQADNLANLKAIHELLNVSPGSTILLRGHVDDARKEEFRKQGGESFVREMSLKAIALSTERAAEIEKRLVEVEHVDDKRVEAVGIGWDEPTGASDPDLNRRVEVQWFTLE